MKRAFVIVLVGLVCLALPVSAEKAMKVERDFSSSSFIGFAPDKFIVVLKEGAPELNAKTSRNGLALTGNQSLDDLAAKYEVTSFGKQFAGARTDASAMPTERVLARHYKVYFNTGNLEEAMAAYRQLPYVEKVDPIAIHAMSATPCDLYYDSSSASFPYYQWHYWEPYGIEANLAWDDETGSSDVVVAVLDGGVRYYHHELGGTDPPGPNDNVTNGNIWVNSGEIPGNGIDDDNNGFVDDVIGWDFVETADQCTDADCGGVDNDPADFGGHGTHVSGTIAAITNNDPTWGVAGVAGGWNDGTTGSPANGVKIMPLRIGYQTRRGGVVYMDYAAEAMFYVATMVEKGVNVAAINCSWGSSSYGSMPAAVDNLLAHDVMIIVAAGNSNSSTPDYLGLRDDCLDVGATDKTGTPPTWTNYGDWVDVAAPGVEILSTFHNSDDPTYDYISLMDGTSMSCPHVVGVAALLESKDPNLTGPEKFDIIVNNTNPYNPTKYVGTGIVSAKKTLDAVGPVQNPPVAGFSGTPTSGDVPLTVQFTDLSTNSPTSWSWDFGDGVGTSTVKNPSYTYAFAGTYTVTLTATNAYGSDSETKTNYISVTQPANDPPVADFTASPTSGDAPLAVQFTDLSTNDPASWNWDFGDGVGTSTVKNPSYTYTAAGTYTVSLTATNAYGSDTETKTDFVTVTEPQTGDMHVYDIAVTRVPLGRNCIGRAVVTVYDAGNQPVANATVYAAVTGNTTESVSGVTAADGTVTLQSAKTKTCDGEWCFEVTNVTHPSLTYNAAANLVTRSCESGDVYGVENGIAEVLPHQFNLDQNYPNPFNPTTEISFSLPSASSVKLEIFNIAGQRVALLAEGFYSAGSHTVSWDASGRPSGIYLYRLTTGNNSVTKKMILLK